jgi:hypothetical protein
VRNDRKEHSYLTILDYHHLKASEVAARDPARLESAVRSERADFPEHVESLLPPADERYLKREGWPHYQKLHRLCELYQAGSPAQREFIRSKMNWNRAFQLALFRAEAREVAVRTKSEELLRLSIVSLAINDFTCGDARDAIVALGSELGAARKIGLDWSALVRGVAGISGPGMAALLQDFLGNHPF